MPLITVLTPAHSAARPYLAETAQSVLTQTTPAGWELEWIVQVDGTDDKLIRETLPDDPRLQLDADGAALGVAATRNIALSRARGTYVQNLDADDLLLPGALETTIAAFEEHRNVHWAYGQADDLMPDGTRVEFDPWMPPAGLVPAGRLTAWMEEHGGNVPVPCAAVSYRTTTLRALGGWMALPIGEDLGLVAAISAVTDGWQDPSTTWLYRQHPGQISRHEAQPRWSATARKVALQRISALRLTQASFAGVDDETNHNPAVHEAMKTAVDIPDLG